MHLHKPGIRKGAVAWLATLMLLITSAGTVLADTSTANSQAAGRALTWMHTQQQPDGSFAGFGAGSTVDAVLAIVAAGQDPSTFSQGGNTPITFLQKSAKDMAKTAGGVGKLLIAAHALSMDPKSFGGVDLVGAIQATYGISATGQYGGSTIDSAFAILGLHAAGQTVPQAAIQRLGSLQTSGGGWSFSGDTTPNSADTNTTAVVVQALIEEKGTANLGSDLISRAVQYLTTSQNQDGGWPYQQGGAYGSDSDVNSTAYVVQALTAVTGSEDLVLAGQKFILSLQNKSGAFAYQKSQPDDNAGATYQAVPALLDATFINTQPAPAPVVTPGMPTTGNSVDLPLAAFGLVSALATIGLGAAARRKAVARQEIGK